MWLVFHCTQWLDSCSSGVSVVSQLSRPFSELKWFCWKHMQVNSWPLTRFPLSRTHDSLCSVTLQGVTAESPRPSDDRARARLNQWREEESWRAGSQTITVSEPCRLSSQNWWLAVYKPTNSSTCLMPRLGLVKHRSIWKMKNAPKYFVELAS